MDHQIESEEIGSVPICGSCGSEHVVRDAWACFNPRSGLWELEDTRDGAYCHRCETSTALKWIAVDATTHKRVQILNDRMRTQGLGNGSIMLTPGIQAEGQEFVVAAVDAVRTFSDFSEDNDPWGEHDFGAIDLSGKKIFWKIDCYDPTLSQGSENPANEALTHRVLTIMLAEEY